MSRSLALCLLSLAAPLAATAALAQGQTTQIEGRPTYGATVTIEEGVRVFRPLPGDRHVIVNPNRTPLVLDVGDRRVINQNSANTGVVIRNRRY